MDKVDDVSFMKRCFRRVSVRQQRYRLLAFMPRLGSNRSGQYRYDVCGLGGSGMLAVDSSVGVVIHVEIRVSFCLRHSFHDTYR